VSDPEPVIAICLEKGIDLIITLIAVLKIGAAYLPLDPQYAFNRLSYMLENSRASILITQDKYKKKFDFFSGKILDVENYKVDGDKNLSKEKCNKKLCRDSLAYVIYTSGSTGQPKGIMNTHGSIVNCFKYFNKVMPLTSQDVYIQQASISFDTSIEEIFRSLMNCCRIILTSTDEYYDVEKLAELITKQQATIVQFIPNKLSQFVDCLDGNKCQSLLQVYCGGEPLSPDLCEHFYSKMKAKLFNAYGPSESYYTNVYEVPRKYI
jgi:non-ribosomal peptide synthetase component F